MAARGNEVPPLTLYTSLLQATIEDVPDEEEEALAVGIANLLRKRAEMTAVTAGRRPGTAPERARATMSYDAALVRLCQRLDIDHLFFAGVSPDAARAEAEAALAHRMPALSTDFLGNTGSVTDQPLTAAGGSETGA